MAKGQTSSIEPPFPRDAIIELEECLGRSLDGWEERAPAHRSPPPGEGVEGAWFDVGAVVKVVEQLRAMPHTSGRWRGAAFEPESWQIVWIIAPVYGWKNAEGLRIVAEVWDEIGRKNGKTTLSARLGIIMLSGDGEWGAEVYAAAGSKEQAGFMFTPARSVAERSRALKGKLEVLTGIIRAPRTGGIFRVLSKAGDLAHGANVHCGLIDEIHVHKNRDLIDAIDSGTGGREQPLIFYTTTANDGNEQSIYGELHKRALGLASRTIVDPSTYVVIWCASHEDDPFAPETIRKANPNYPISPSRAYIERKIKKAQDTPTWLPTYKRLHLNIAGAAAEAAWPGAEEWQHQGNGGLVEVAKLKGKPAWGGVVATYPRDLTAIAWVFRNPEGAGYWALWRWFLPEDSLDKLDERTNGEASVWAREKRITLTDGDYIDLEAHREQVRADAKVFEVREVAYDPNPMGLMTPLVDDFGDRLVPYYSTNPSSALMDWERLLGSGEFNHGGDAIAAWMVRHVRVKDAATGVVKIDRKGSTENVSGIAAAEIALRRALVHQDEKPAVLGGIDF